MSQHADLLRQLAELRTRAKLRIGVVSATAPLAVKLGGSDVAYTDVRRLASYVPTVGDTVAVLVAGNTLLVLGNIA